MPTSAELSIKRYRQARFAEQVKERAGGLVIRPMTDAERATGLAWAPDTAAKDHEQPASPVAVGTTTRGPRVDCSP